MVSRGLIVVLFIVALSALSPAATGLAAVEGTTLESLIAGARSSNQQVLAAGFKARQYHSRIELSLNLDDPLLAFYYLDFPVRILRESVPSPAPTTGATSTTPATTDTIRGKALFERSAFMIRAMTENRAAWFQGISEDLQLQVAGEIRENFYRLYFQDRIIAVTEETLVALDHLLAASRERYALGQLRQKEVLQIQTEKTRVRARLLDLRQERLALAANLNYLAGRPPGTPLHPQPGKDLTQAGLQETFPPLADLTNFMKQHRPLVKGYKSLVETFGIMRLMIPMYYNRVLSREGLLEVESAMRATKAELADFQNKVAAELTTESGQLEKTVEVARLYGELLLPQARQVLAASQADFAVGRADLREPLQAIVTLNQYQTEYYQALADHQKSLARVEAASAMPLP